MGFMSKYRNQLRWFYYGLLILLAVLFAHFWTRGQPPQPPTPMVQISPESALVNEPIQPIPVQADRSDDRNQNKILLGEKLFQEVRLSQDNRIACASCHVLNLGGTDRRAYSLGVRNNVGVINTPTIFNLKYNFRFNWNGKFETLTQHLENLLTNPEVMDMPLDVLTKKLSQGREYPPAFAQVYADGLNPANLKDAIVTYEASLTTPNARFDQFLRGNKQALTASEQEGYQLFKDYGCVSCHQGINVGGNLFQRFGVMGDYFADRGNITPADLGRFNVTQDPADRFVFRVPSLRNVALTAPYFHDGTAPTLEKAIMVMAKYQLGRALPPEHISRIADFLRTLTGEYRGQPLR
jgi:cytochrome c peroxidase